MDTNFTSPLRGIDITRYLLEERIGSTEEREVAKYILKATYGEVKSVFESVKSGKIIAPPHIQGELAKRKNAMNVAVGKSRPPFNQLGYFLQFYERSEAEEMTRYAKGIVGIENTLLGYLQSNGNEYKNKFKTAEAIATKINSKFSLPKKVNGDSPSIEDIIISCLGIIIPNSMLCSEDIDCYRVLDFIKTKSKRRRISPPTICSSTQVIKVGEVNFSDRFGRYRII